MTISRTDMNRQLYMQGGLGTLTPRKKYGFGSFVSSITGGIGDILGGAADVVGDVVGGAADVVGDVVGEVTDFAKSDIGKAALLAAGGYYLGGGSLLGAQRAGSTGFQFGNILKPSLGGITDAKAAGSIFTQRPAPLDFAVTGGGSTVPSSVVGMEVPLGSPTVPSSVASKGLPLNIEQLQRQATLPDTGVLSKIGNTASKVGSKALNLGKKGFDKVFFDDGKLDVGAVLATASILPTYLDAKRFAEEQGVSEEEFDESEYIKMRERYRLSGFKDGGRIPFADGSKDPAPISGDELKKIIEDFMKNQEKEEELRKNYRDGSSMMSDEGDIVSMTDDNSGVIYMSPDGKQLTKDEFFEMVDNDPDQFKKEPQGILDLMEPETVDMLKKEKVLEKLGIEAMEPKTPSIKLREAKKDMEGYTTFEDLGLKRNEERVMVMDKKGKLRVVPKAEAEKSGLNIAVDSYDTEQIMRREGKMMGGRIGYKEGSGKIDTMGDLSESDLNMYKDMKGALISKILDDAPGSASNMVELLNPFDDKPADTRSYDGRISDFNKAVKDVKYGIISTKNDPEARSKFIENFEKKFGRNINSVPNRENKMMGGEVPVRKNQGGITELDFRESGGFVPVGIKERADDVPAMLSKNEFVMTADAVRGIGNGSVQQGAQRLYNIMKQAEKTGRA